MTQTRIARSPRGAMILEAQAFYDSDKPPCIDIVVSVLWRDRARCTLRSTIIVDSRQSARSCVHEVKFRGSLGSRKGVTLEWV